jgi:hypothetical protein
MVGSDWLGSFFSLPFFFFEGFDSEPEAGWQYDSGCTAVPIKTANERLGAQRFIVSQLDRAALVLHVDEAPTRDIIDQIEVLIICPKSWKLHMMGSIFKESKSSGSRSFPFEFQSQGLLSVTWHAVPCVSARDTTVRTHIWGKLSFLRRQNPWPI